MLEGKKILLFIGGSIACYKSLYLIRALVKEGAKVRCIASPSALKFITPLSIETLSRTTLLMDGNENWAVDEGLEVAPNHIAYAKWAELALFAPATANSINKLAAGLADNTYLASALCLHDIPKILAPSANTRMLENPATKASLRLLSQRGYTVLPASHGWLACGELGNGAMARGEDLIFLAKKALYSRSFWREKRVLVTGGGSSEDVDSIRCLSNHSSGLMACNLALALYFLGARVCFISSKFPLDLPSDMEKVEVRSTADYLEALQGRLDSNEEKIYVFMASALSDYAPVKREGKLKKRDLGDKLSLELHQTIDVLAALEDKNLVKIAFKAECDEARARDEALKVLDSKNCQLVCLNVISDENPVFGQHENSLVLLSRDSAPKEVQGSKLATSLEICHHVEALGL